MAKKEVIYTTQDIKNNINKMEEEGLSLDAPVEVTVEGDGDTYDIESLGHFHAVPNMTLRLKLKNYTKKNGDQTLTLRNFLNYYNFREIVSDKEDTQVIRIYVEFPSKYFEFGVNEWGYSHSKDEIIEQVMNKKILDRAVRSFDQNTTNDIFCVYLEEIE